MVVNQYKESVVCEIEKPIPDFFFPSTETAAEMTYCAGAAFNHSWEQDYSRMSQVQDEGPKGDCSGMSKVDLWEVVIAIPDDGCLRSNETSSRQ